MMINNSNDEYLHGIKALPSDDSVSKNEYSNFYSDHVPLFIKIPTVDNQMIQILSWNVFDDNTYCGYDFPRHLFNLNTNFSNTSDGVLYCCRIKFLTEFKKKYLHFLKVNTSIPNINDCYQQALTGVTDSIQTLIDEKIDLMRGKELDSFFSDIFKPYQDLKDIEQIKSELLKVQQQFPGEKIKLKRNERIADSITYFINENKEISILAFQEMTDSLTEVVKKKLGVHWVAVCGKNVTFYNNKLWICRQDSFKKDALLDTLTLQTRENNKNTIVIELNNIHGQGGEDKFDQNLNKTINILFPGVNDQILRVVVGDFNTPIREIKTTGDVTHKNISSSLSCIDGAFASQKSSLIECNIQSLDPTTGRINSSINIDIVTNQQNKKYLESEIKQSTLSFNVNKEKFNLRANQYYFKQDLLLYAKDRFITNGKKKYLNSYFIFSKLGYSIDEKAKALQLFYLFSLFQIQQTKVYVNDPLQRLNNVNIISIDKFFEKNIKDIPKLIRALKQGRLGDLIDKNHSSGLQELERYTEEYMNKNQIKLFISGASKKSSK